MLLFQVSCLYSPSLLLRHCQFRRPNKKKKEEVGGGSLGILSGSSSGAHSLPHHSFILALLHTDSRLSLSCFFQLLPFFSLGLYVLTCPQEHLLSFYDSYTLSLYFNSLVVFFMSFPYSIFSAFYSHHYHFLVYNLLPCHNLSPSLPSASSSDAALDA